MASLTSAGITFGDGTTQTTAVLTNAAAAYYQNVINGVATATDTQTFNASGTWTKLGSGTLALIEVWGAGGSGGRNSGITFSSGGGGGGYKALLVPLSLLPASVTVTVGAGGASRTGSNQIGATGGTSSFGSVVSATGGAGGAITASVTSAGGAGGAVTAPYVTDNPFNALTRPNPSELGGLGGPGFTSGCPSANAATAGGSTTSSGGGGGGRANTTYAAGGTSTYGGAGSAGAATSSAGIQPGGGSGGASTTSGAGGDGRVRVTVY